MKNQLGSALLCLAVLSLTAQAQDYKSSIRYWDAGRLTLEDFTVRDMWSLDDKATSVLARGWQQEEQTLRFGNLRYDRPVTRTYMDKVNSWIKTGTDVHEALLFNQVIFDLAEATRRKMQHELDTNRTSRPDAIGNFYATVCENAVNEFIASSRHGTDTAVVRKYQANLNQTLAEPDDGLSEPVIPMGKWGVGWYLGAAGEYFLGEGADFLSPRYGLEFGFETAYGRLRLDMNAILAFGSLRKDVPFWQKDDPEKISPWSAGERISGGAVEFFAGCDVLDNAHFTLTPFAGAGAGFIDRANRYLQKDGSGKLITEELAGFRMLAGLQGDWKLRRRYSILGYYGRTYSETTLRFRLYVAKTNFRSPCHPCSLNFGIALNGFGRDVR